MYVPSRTQYVLTFELYPIQTRTRRLSPRLRMLVHKIFFVSYFRQPFKHEGDGLHCESSVNLGYKQTFSRGEVLETAVKHSWL